MEEVRRSTLREFAERRAFSPATMCCSLFLSAHTHTRTNFHSLFLSLPHIQAHFVFRQPCARHVLSAFGQRFIVPWSRCHFTLHWPPSNYSIYPLLKGGGAAEDGLQHSLTRRVATVCLFLLSLYLSLSPVLPMNSKIISFNNISLACHFSVCGCKFVCLH